MKKIFYGVSMLAGLALASCEEAEVSSGENAGFESSLAQKQGTIFTYIESKHIENGVDCDNNILIFPSWALYNQTIDQLDDMTETYCDNFDAAVPNNISDDEYDALAAASNFDEDNILRKLEEDLAFCSLRRKIENEEAIWLDAQGDGAWDANADPDNHFIDEESERTLLSYRAEVIIGDKKKGFVYYRFLNDEGSWIEVHNDDTAAMSQVSQGNVPVNNPNVVIVKPSKADAGNTTSGCKNKVKEVKYESAGGDRVKRISKVRRAVGTNCSSSPCTSIFPSKIKSKTKGYKKKNGKWKARRLWIAAGINGSSQPNPGLSYVDCLYENPTHKYKEKRRRHVKVKVTTTTYIPPSGTPQNYNSSMQDNMLYSYHKKGSLIINTDFYDMPQN